MEHKCIVEDLEVLVHRRAGHLGVVGDVGEVDDRAVAVGGDAQEPAERRDIAGVGLEIRPRIVGEVDRGQRAAGDSPGIEVASQLARDQWMEVLRPRAPAEVFPVCRGPNRKCDFLWISADRSRTRSTNGASGDVRVVICHDI